MSESAEARRMRLLEELAGGGGGELEEVARRFGVDSRTIRRDAELLDDLARRVERVDIRRGQLTASSAGFGDGYFANQAQADLPAKEAIACAVARRLADNTPVLIGAGSTTWHVARELRRLAAEPGGGPRGLIVFTNSLPALRELIGAGIDTGVIGEVYNPDDCAFHSHDLRSAFHPAVAVVGVSGLVADGRGGRLDLFSHRSEEAAFMRQALALPPEIIVAAGPEKVGRRHPWSFTPGGPGESVLAGKRVALVTGPLNAEQRESLDTLVSACAASAAGFTFEYEECRSA